MSHASLVKKLSPRSIRVSGKLTAIIAYLLDQHWTNPQIAPYKPSEGPSMSISSDGFVLARDEGDIGFNNWIGTAADFRRSLAGLSVAAELTPQEVRELNSLVVKRVESWERYYG
jgi:hypothetical protein